MNIPICINCNKGKLTDEQWEAYGHHLEADAEMGPIPFDEDADNEPYCVCCEHQNIDPLNCDLCEVHRSVELDRMVDVLEAEYLGRHNGEVTCDCGSTLDKDEMKMNGFVDGVQTHDHPSCRNCLVGDYG